MRAHHWAMDTFEELEETPIALSGLPSSYLMDLEGVSELIHLDWNDHPASITWAIPVWDSDWVGSDLWVPQVDALMPLKNGDAATLAHVGTKIAEGSRPVFTDKYLLKAALKATT